MDEKTTKIIKERFDALPESIKEIILSSHYEETLLEIGKQYNLNVEQLGILERETTLTMMGLIPTKDFENELTRELNIDKSKGSQITKDINEKIFLKIRELLKLMNTPAGEEPNLEETPIPTKTTITENEEKYSARQDLEENDTHILNSAGIKILNENKIEPMPKSPIFVQKLSGYVKNDIVETKHSLDNITKTNNTATTPNVSSSKPAIDPYREIPE